MLHKYIKQRGSCYHFRWRIPVDLQPVLGVTELTRSLYTSDLLEAGFKAGRFVEAVARVKRIRWAYFAQEIDADVYVSEVKKYWGFIKPMARKEKTIRTELITFFNTDGTKFCVVDHKGDEKKEALASRELKDAGVLPDGLTMLKEADRVEGESKVLLSEFFESFMAHKTDTVRAQKDKRKPLSEKMQQQYRRDIGVLVAIMGDVPISLITKKMLRDAILTYGMLPKRNKKPYKGLPILELLEMEVPETDRIRDKVTVEVRKFLQGMFKFALEEDVIKTSPARDLGLNFSGQGTFAQFDNVEVRTMLKASSKESVAWKKWLLPLAAYTGARRGELVQLRKGDIKYDSNSQRHYILVTADAGSVKNENANRQIPLHRELVKMGFLDFVDEADDRLFEGLNPHTVTNWFTDFRIAQNIDNYDDDGDRKVFHSFRHTFVTRARGAGNPNVNVAASRWA